MSSGFLGGGIGPSAIKKSGLKWLLRDEFTTDRAAGAVNGTAAEPGPGTRTTQETDGQWTISSGALTFTAQSSPAWGDLDLLYSGGITRTAGRMLIMRLNLSTVSNFAAGWNRDTDFTGPTSDVDAGVDISANIITVRHLNQGTTAIGAFTASTNHNLVIILRATGAFYLLDKILIWRNEINNTATIYPFISNYASAGTIDFLRIPDALWLPTPLLSAGFGGTFGTTDGLGHAEGIAGGIGAGGGGVTLSNAGGTWANSGGKAVNTTPSGLVQQISVASIGVADVMAGADVVRALSTQVGLALNWDSSSSPANGVLVYSDGAGNIKVDKYVSGSASNVSTTAYTYSAGARLVVHKSGTSYRTYYGNALVKVDTIADAGIVSNTLHGIFSTDAANTLDNLTIYATGSNGEYAELDRYSA